MEVLQRHSFIVVLNMVKGQGQLCFTQVSANKISFKVDEDMGCKYFVEFRPADHFE